jgi:23S rRNA (guanosine2251-2'-O)-methyltransferase
MTDTRLIHGFHAITAKLRHAADDVKEITVAEGRQDGRMRDLLRLAEAHGVRVIMSDTKRLDGLAGGTQHQGVVAKVAAQAKHVSLDDVLEGLAEPALLLVLDGVTDPHNLGACLRVADAAGAHAVVAPKDKACGLNATVIKVASGAADTVPYIVVTNLARSPCARCRSAASGSSVLPARPSANCMRSTRRVPAPGCSAPKATACGA